MTQTSSRAPFVIAALVAALPLLVLAAAAPGGDQWRTLEYPRHITLLAIALGIWVSFARVRPTAAIVLAGTVVITLLWELVGEYHGLSKFGRTDLFGSELNLLVDSSIGALAPWLVGTLYAVLAFLSIGRSRADQTNRRRAAIWLIAVAILALGITLANESWLTLENLKADGTYRSSSSWPDTKQLSLVADLLALAAGVVALVYRKQSNLPKATLRE